MKQKFFHLLALLFLLSISSISFGMDGRVAYSESEYSSVKVRFQPLELQQDKEYRIEGKLYTYKGRLSYCDPEGNITVGDHFHRLDDQLLLVVQNDGSFLITHEKNGTHKSVYNTVSNSNNNKALELSDDDNSESEEGKALFSYLLEKYKKYQKKHSRLRKEQVKRNTIYAFSSNQEDSNETP